MDAIWEWQAAALPQPTTPELEAPETLAPKTGTIGVNHDQPNQATMLYIHRQDTTETDRSGRITRLTAHDRIYLQAKTQSQSWHRYEVTGRPNRVGDVWCVPVTTEVGSPQGTEPPNNTLLLVEIP